MVNILGMGKENLRPKREAWKLERHKVRRETAEAQAMRQQLTKNRREPRQTTSIIHGSFCYRT